MKNYPTDLTEVQLKVIEKIVNDKRKRKYSLGSIVNALLYITKTGVQWRLLPSDFPKWQLVYYYFRWVLKIHFFYNFIKNTKNH